MSRLPEGWEHVELGHMLAYTIGGVWGLEPGSADIDVDVIRVTEMNPDGQLDPSTAARRSITSAQLESRRLQMDDLLLEKSGGGPNKPVGRVGRIETINGASVCANFMQLMRPNQALVAPKYLEHFLRFLHSAGGTESLQTATTNIRNLKTQDYLRIAVPVPPRAEQERIVTAIEEHLSHLNAAEDEMPSAERRIRALERAIITEASSTLAPPSHWKVLLVGDVGIVGLGLQRSPKRHNGPHMRPYLRVANVFEDRIDTRDVMSMNMTDAEWERYRLRDGDVLLNEGQSPELLGRPAIYRGQPPDVAFTNSLIRFQAKNDVDPEWALLVFRSHLHNRRFMRESQITTNIAHLAAGRFKTVEFPVPPLEEQVSRVANARARLEACERLRTQVVAGRKRSSALRRSILVAAFSGRLVQQNPDDEHTSDLLRRIMAEPGGSSPTGRKSQRKAS